MCDAASRPVLIVCGSRAWTDWPTMRATLDHLWCAPMLALRAVWHGGAQGADLMATTWAEMFPGRVPVRSWPADWSLGPHAGVKRSAEMVGSAPAGSVVVAFVSCRLSDSVGTSHTVRLALRRGLRVLARCRRPCFDGGTRTGGLGPSDPQADGPGSTSERREKARSKCQQHSRPQTHERGS